MRLTQHFFLRQAELLADITGGDLLLGVVFIAISSANTGYLAEPSNDQHGYADLDDLPPDELRRPVSVLAIAESLRLPYETARRYVARLEAQGLVRRVGRQGVIVPTSALMTSDLIEKTRRSFNDVQRFVVGLRRAGVDVDSMR
ncbi:MAG TPA: hypothetical protein VG939_04320 [Caulobacteraceae bacterium]|nr:hypothetical protein [Caulobacteraceae bacterium]